MSETAAFRAEDKIEFEHWFEVQFNGGDRFEIDDSEFQIVEILPHHAAESNGESIGKDYFEKTSPILVIPGFLSNKESNKSLLHHLASMDLHVAMIDIIRLRQGSENGHGGPPAIAQKAAGINEAVNRLGYPRLDVLAHSMALMPLVYAQQERDDNVLRNVVAVSPAGVAGRANAVDYMNAVRMFLAGISAMNSRANSDHIWSKTIEYFRKNTIGTIVEGLSIPQQEISPIVADLRNPLDISILVMANDKFIRSKRIVNSMSKDGIEPYVGISSYIDREARHHAILTEPEAMEAAIDILRALRAKEQLKAFQVDRVSKAAGFTVLNREVDTDGLLSIPASDEV
ncbi:MAG: hypothetical protein R3313_03740 [Candidatus Saccharimonadales bacterium]|nr:hypothetical protein [Candidatus Saccharimonadales bacterium]